MTRFYYKYEGPVVVDAKLYKLYGPREAVFGDPITPYAPKSAWFEVVTSAIELIVLVADLSAVRLYPLPR